MNHRALKKMRRVFILTIFNISLLMSMDFQNSKTMLPKTSRELIEIPQSDIKDLDATLQMRTTREFSRPLLTAISRQPKKKSSEEEGPQERSRTHLAESEGISTDDQEESMRYQTEAHSCNPNKVINFMGETLLYRAIAQGNIALVIFFLNNGAHIHPPSCTYSALQFARIYGQNLIAKLLECYQKESRLT
jgi:hypothetical protein